MKVALVIIVFIYSVNCVPQFRNGRYKKLLLDPPKPKNVHLPPDLWFTQKLNHFNDAESRTWNQRYFINDTFYKPGGPVFLMIGGEGPASPTWMVTGSWIKYAQKYNAFCFQLEHRFYGKSHPTSDLSVENLKFLSSEQALADLAYFIQAMTEQHSLGGAKWIAFGGSYPGSLSAWLRYKYPHLIHASVSTSAPVFAVLNFKGYLGVVRDSLGLKDPNCNINIAQATHDIEQLMAVDAGRKKLETLFNLCDPIDTADPFDAENFFATVAGNVEGIVQYNKDNRAFEGAVGSNITIDTVCSMMADTKLGDQLERYAALSNMLLKTYSQKCLDASYNKMIENLKSTDYGMAAGGRQWTYQTCTEFGFFQTSDLKMQPFGQHFPQDYFVQQCIDIFGPLFNDTTINRGIKETNINYGGYGLKVSRVVFVNGSIDPWHALGIIKALGKDAPAIYIKGTAHCANMYPDSPDDPAELKVARTKIDSLIGKWLQQS